MDEALEVWAEEAAEEVAKEVAERMLLNNEPIDKITEYTKLPEKKILELMKKLAESI
jgi:hypothetical protein